MSEAFAEIERDLLTRGNQPVSAAELLQALRLVGNVVEEIARHRRVLRDMLVIADERPTSAPFGALIRVRGDLTGALYLGNGYKLDGTPRPLTKLLPVAV